MKYNFKVGDKVKIIHSGYGCGLDKMGRVTKITELGVYNENGGCKLEGIFNHGYGDFIGFESIELIKPSTMKELLE
jgi:hypothetical protein